jgi:hypothetical protein
MPIYRIEAKLGQAAETRLIEAKTESGALKHAAKKYLTAAPIRTGDQIKDMAALAANGVKVEAAAEAE